VAGEGRGVCGGIIWCMPDARTHRRQRSSESLELAERLAHVLDGVDVQQGVNDGLGGARVVDGLPREEDLLGLVELAAAGADGGGAVVLLAPLEQEHDGVHRGMLRELERVQRHHLAELHILDAEGLH
jgi:hypothetical protein